MACMLGHHDSTRATQLAEKKEYCLFDLLITKAFVLGKIGDFETESVIEFNLIGRNTSLLSQFPQRRDTLILAGYDVALGQVPAVTMPHQQK